MVVGVLPPLDTCLSPEVEEEVGVGLRALSPLVAVEVGGPLEPSERWAGRVVGEGHHWVDALYHEHI